MDLPKDTTWTRLKIICGSRRSLKIQVYLNSIFPVVFHFLFGFGWFYYLFCTPIIIFCLMRRKKSFKSFSISGTIVTLVNYLNSGSNWYLVWRDLKSKSRKNQWIKWIFRLVLFRCVWPFLWWSSCMTLFLRTLFIKLDYQSKEQRFILHLPLWFALHLHYTYLLVLHPFPSLVV